MIPQSSSPISFVFVNLLLNIVGIFAIYEVPSALVEPLSPRGFRVSIADDAYHKINIFAFHGRINEEMNGREAGQFSKDITQSENGRWTFEDTKTELKSGDVIYYWTYVELISENGAKVGYPLDDQMFTVKELQPVRESTNQAKLIPLSEAIQILITCLLAFAFSHFMSVLQCSVPTACGLLAGFITLPTVVQLRSAQIKLQATGKHGFAMWYKRMAIVTCTALQSVSFSVALVNLFGSKSRKRTFLTVMQDYGNRQRAKSIIDNIQWFMQCCGAYDYEDWYEVNWGNSIIDPFHSKKRKAMERLLISDTDDYPDLTALRSDAVPFSCCAEVATSGCIHQNLEQFGAYTINTIGCGNQLDSINYTILVIELIIYTIGLLIETMMLLQLCKSHHKEFDDLIYTKHHGLKALHSTEKREFSKFLNDDP